MTKKQQYHINHKGEVKVCTATKQPCIFGEHFNSEYEAELHLDKKYFQQDFLQSLKNEEPQYEYDEELVDRIYMQEPEITVILTRLAKRLNFRMDGLEYRLKQKDSIRDKILVRKEAHSVEELNDIIRYTIVADTKNYRETQKRVLIEMLEEDIQTIKISDSWDLPGYKGVNCKLRKGEVKFELQFHTPESLRAKEQVHPFYEESRLIQKKDDPRKIFLDEEMDRIFNSIPKPN